MNLYIHIVLTKNINTMEETRKGMEHLNAHDIGHDIVQKDEETSNQLLI